MKALTAWKVKRMNKIRFLMPLLMLFLACSFPALADQQAYPLPRTEGIYDEEYWLSETYEFLVSGDTVHFLKYRYGCGRDMLDDEDMWIMEVDGGDCYTLGAGGEIVPCPDHCGEIIGLIETSCYHPFFGLVTTPENETFLIDMTGKVFHWTPGGDAAWEDVLQLDMTGLRPIASDQDDFYCAADEDGLYMLWPSALEGIDLYAFDWQTGQKRLLAHFGWTYGVDPAGPGRLLVDGSQKTYGNGRYYLVDTQSGEVTELAFGLQGIKVSPFIWNRADGWYYVTYNNVQRLGMDAEEVSVANLTAKDGWRYAALSTDGQRLLILADEYPGYSFIVLDLQDAGTTLTITGNTNLLNRQFGGVSSMAGDEPELAGVQFRLREGVMSANDVAQLLLTRDDTCDVLIVSAASVDLRGLFAKGYFAALEDRPEIRDYVDQLYPVWRDACMWQDSIAVLPLWVYDNYQFMVNTELWEEYGLEIPTSYHELFEAIREMDGEGLLENYPLFEINGRDTRSFDHLAYKLLGDYMLHCEAAGTGMRFDDRGLEQLLQELSELRELLDRHDDRHLTGIPLMAWAGHVTSLGDQLYTQYGEYAPVQLALDDVRGPILQVYLSVLLVNPYSKNVDLAKAWLAHLAANPTEMTRCIFLTGMPDGIETEESRIAYAAYEEREAALVRQYEEAVASGDPEAIEKASEAMFDNPPPMHTWVVAPEKAQALYSVLPGAQVVRYSPQVILMDNGEQAIQEYLTGRRSAHDLLQALQSLAMMIDAEGQ